MFKNFRLSICSRPASLLIWFLLKSRVLSTGRVSKFWMTLRLLAEMNSSSSHRFSRFSILEIWLPFMLRTLRHLLPNRPSIF